MAIDWSVVPGALDQSFAADLARRELLMKSQAALAEQLSTLKRNNEAAAATAEDRRAQAKLRAAQTAAVISTQLTKGQDITDQPDTQAALPSYQKQNVPGSLPSVSTIGASTLPGGTSDLANGADVTPPEGENTTTQVPGQRPKVVFAGNAKQQEQDQKVQDIQDMVYESDPTKKAQKAVALQLKYNIKTMPGPDGSAHMYQVDSTTGAITDLGAIPGLKNPRIATKAGDIDVSPYVLTERPKGPGNNKAMPVIGLTPNQLYQDGTERALTGKLPAYGLGQNPTVIAKKNAIDATAAALATAAGTDMPTLQAEYKAATQSGNRLVTVAAQTAAVAGSAKGFADLAEDASDQLWRTGSPVINEIIQKGQRHLTGSPQIAQLDQYIFAMTRDYGKVVSGSAASSVGITDTQASRTEQLLNAAQNPAAFKAVIQAMRNDMDVVVTNQSDQVGRTYSAIGNFLKVRADVNPDGTRQAGGADLGLPAPNTGNPTTEKQKAAPAKVGDVRTDPKTGKQIQFDGKGWKLLSK